MTHIADDDIITLETYYDPMLAHIIRARLEQNGIPCFLADENMLTINPLYNNALGGVKLKVFARDAEQSRAILAEVVEAEQPEAAVEPDTDITTCPHCGSVNVRYGTATKIKFGFLNSLMVAICFFFIRAYPLSFRKAWHCFNCGDDF